MSESATANLVNESPIPQTRFLRGWTAQLLWIVPAILVFAPTIYWLWQRWTMSVWHNVHGLFIPLIAALFIRKTLRSDPIKDADQSAWGFLFLIFGLGMVALDSAIRTQLLSAFALVVCLPGFSLLLLGKRRTKELAFVWILCFFMLPIPAAFVERLIVVLRNLTAVGAEYCLTLLGVPMVREGTLLVLPRANLEIADACSGFATLYASFTLALILAVLTPSWPRRLLLLVAAFPIAVVCNILRATLLALAVERWGIGILSTTFHPASGVLMFTLAAILLAFLSGLRKEEPAA